MIRSLTVCLLLLPTLAQGAAGGALPPAATRALAAIEEGASASHSDAILVMRGDDVLLERASAAAAKPIELMSVTKSVVALAIGALLADGKLESLDTPVHQFYPEWKQGRKKIITVRMLMDHTSGLQNLLRPKEEVYAAPDVIQLALAAELSHDPGKHFAYNNKAVNLLAGIVHKATGEPLDAYVTRRLLQPLGIERGRWYKDPSGNPHAMAGLALRARDAAAIGRLVLARGQHQGRPLVSAAFVDEMLGRSRLSSEAGLLWWRHVAWVRFHADDDSFALLQKAGLDAELLEKLRPLKGRAFPDVAALEAALAECWGEQWIDLWYRELIAPHGIGPWKPFHPEKGPVERYEANGSFGQYIVIVPKAGLVAVRQIVDREDHPDADDYADFGARVQALADALATSPPAP